MAGSIATGHDSHWNGATGFQACITLPNANNSIYCWGDNFNLEAMAPPELEEVDFLEASAELSCAIARGTAQCWSDDRKAVRLVDEVAHLEAGAASRIRTLTDEACLVFVDGSIRCVGHPRGRPPLQFPPGRYVDLMMAINGGGCALRTSGELACVDAMNQPLKGVPQGPFRAISGTWSVLALTESGTATTFHLDGGPTVDGEVKTRPGPFVAISSDGVACGLRPTGKLECWDGWGEEVPP